jgi:hypothetical protein
VWYVLVVGFATFLIDFIVCSELHLWLAKSSWSPIRCALLLCVLHSTRYKSNLELYDDVNGIRSSEVDSIYGCDSGSSSSESRGERSPLKI